MVSRDDIFASFLPGRHIREGQAIGKAVTVEASRARDGSRSGLLRIITLPGGKVISLCPQNC
jgi:hypothetical protein